MKQKNGSPNLSTPKLADKDKKIMVLKKEVTALRAQLTHLRRERRQLAQGREQLLNEIKPYRELRDQMRVIINKSKTRGKVGMVNEVLSEREVITLRLSMMGFTSEDIGKKLGKSRKTIDGRKNAIIKKLGVRRIQDAIIQAIENNQL